MKVQSFKSPEDGFDDPETTENSIYTDDYQTEDAFAQIPASNEFVEEETQEISSIEPKGPAAGKPAAEAFPAIQKLETFRPKPGKKPKAKPEGRRRERAAAAPHRFSGRERRAKFKQKALSSFAPAFKAAFCALKRSSKEIAVVAAGTAVLSGCLLILGFAGLHA